MDLEKTGYTNVLNRQNNTHFSTTANCRVNLRRGFHWVLSPESIRLFNSCNQYVGRHFRFFVDKQQDFWLTANPAEPVSIAFDYWVSIFSSADPFFELPMVPHTFQTITNPITWGTGLTNINIDILADLDRTAHNVTCNNILITELHAVRTDTNNKTTAVAGSDLIDCCVEDNAGTGGDFFGFRSPAESGDVTWAKSGIFWKGDMIQDYIFYPTDGNLECIGAANGLADEYLWVFVKGLVL